MKSDTDIGGKNAGFPTTQHSAVVGIRSQDGPVRARAAESLISVYWKPVYKHLRLRWNASNEEAKDLTQEFFAKSLEKGYFESYDPRKAAFRTFLRVCLDGFVSNARKAEQALKRGGGAVHVSLDFSAAEAELALQRGAASSDLDSFYQREWMRSIMSLAMERLREDWVGSGREIHFKLFERFHLHPGDPKDRPSHADLACEFALTSTQVNNYLASTRKRFRELLLAFLAESSGSDSEYREDARRLFGLEIDNVTKP